MWSKEIILLYLKQSQVLNALTSKLSTLSLQVNVQKSCKIVLRHSNKKGINKLDYDNQPLRQVMDITYLGVVLADDFPVTRCRTS